MKKLVFGIFASAMMFSSSAMACDSCEQHEEGTTKPVAITYDKPEFIKKLKKKTGVSAVSVDESTALAGFYKVYDGNNILYISHDLKYLVKGSIYDLDTRQDITSKELIQKSSVDMVELKALKSITVGTGKIEAWVFTDPDCPVCKIFEKHVKKNVSKYTIHFLMRPLKMHPDARDKARTVLCTSGVAAASTLEEFTTGGRQLTESEKGARTCADADLEKIEAYAAKYKINGTPTLISAYGLMNRGALVDDQLEKFLSFDPAKLSKTKATK